MKKILEILFILVLFVSAYFLYTRQLINNEIVIPSSGNDLKTSIEFEPSSSDINYKVKVAPTVPKVNLQMPSLDRPIIFPVNYLSEIKPITEKKINEISARLKENPNIYNDWINLGLERKNLDDYEGAKEAWEYAGYLEPNNSLSFGNLGNLYGYYLKDTQKAEEYYLKAIEKEKFEGFWYYQTYIFYKEVVKNAEKAKNIIKIGLENNPDDTDLKNILNSL